MTFPAEFSQAFARLAVATRLPADQVDEAMLLIYWEGLADLSIEFVVAGADALQKTAKFFPKVAEWREQACAVALKTVLALPAGRTEPWHFEHAEADGGCDDTGWVRHICYPGTGNTCGHPWHANEGREHAYLQPCSCRSTNRSYQRRHGVPVGREAYGSS